MLRKSLVLFVMLILSCSTAFAQPPNDNCVNATPLNCTVVSGTNIGATTGSDDSYAPADICAASLENTVWYSYTATATGTVNVNFSNMSCASNFGMQLGVFSGPCGGPYTPVGACVSGNPPPPLSFPAVNGTNYFIVCDGDAGDNCTWDVNICPPGCPADAGTATPSMAGQSNTNYLLCDGDVFTLTGNGDHVNSPGPNPGITFGIYVCPPTPGIDPALDPCYTGYVTGTIGSMSSTNSGGSAGGYLGTIIANAPPMPTNNTLYFAPFTLTDQGGLLYDPLCFDVGAAVAVQYLEPITYTATEDCANSQWVITMQGGTPGTNGGSFTVNNLVVTPANAGASLSTGTVANGGTVTVNGLGGGDSFTFDIVDANGCTVQVTGGPYTCCAADAGTATPSMTGQGTNNFILCDGDIFTLTGNGDHTNSPGTNPGITFGIYTCPPTPGIDPALDPCYTGYVTGTIGSMSDQNVGGSAGGLLAAIIASGPPTPVSNNTLYYAPFTLTDQGALLYDPNCFDIGPPTAVQYLEPITFTATEDCANQQWVVTASGGYAGATGGNFTVNNLIVTPANGGASLSTGTIANGGTVTVNGLTNGDSFTFDVIDANGCSITVTGGPYTCCPADAGTSTGTLNGQGTNNFILCDGDIIDITADGNAVNSPGPNPGITFGIYTCPPTPGIDPATDPCYSGYVTGTIGSMSDQNMGGASGGLIGAIIASGPPTPVTNSTLYFAPFTLTDQGALLYDPNCHDVGPPIAVQYLEPITFTATEDCANQQWVVTASGGYAGATGGNFTVNNLVVTPANGSATLSTGTIANGGTVNVNGLVNGDSFTFDVIDGNGCTIQVTGGPYSCCPANAGTISATMSGQSNNTFVLCDGDAVDIQTNNDYTNSPGAAPGITFGIYTCPPTPGMDPAVDPCYTGFVTGTIWNMTDVNIGGSSGGLLGAIIASGPPTPVSNNTLYFSPFTLIDTTGLLYDPNCFDVGPPIAVQYLEPFNNSVTPTNSTCGNADGAIDITASGALAPYQYEVIGVAGPQASSNFPNLPSGTYDVVTHDSNGCTDTVSTTIMDAGAPTITSVTPTDPTCFGVCDGTIVVVAANGVAPLSYDIGAAPQANGTFNAVCSGVYTVTVTDANGCQVTQNVTVFDPPQLTLASSHVDLTCFQVNTGSIDMIGGGGTPPYTYSIDNGVTFVAGNSFINLAAGNYDIVIMDNNGCTVTGTETITEPTELTMTFSTFDASCAGFCDGSAIVIPAGGTLPYVYTWTNGIAGPNDAQASNLCAGTETLTVTDGNGCTIDTTFTINAPTAVTIDAVAVTDVSCNGICDGSIDITAPLATTFSIDNGVNFQASNVFNGLCPGTFDIVVENANGCQATQQVVIAAPAPVTITVSADTTICVGGTATLTGNAAGGSGGFVYVWDNGLAPNQTVSVLPGMQTTYCVYAVDANGCQSPTVCVDVSIAAPLTVSVSPSVASICPGENITLTATGTGGDGNYVFNWDNGMTGSSITVSPATTTVYTVTISDGCSSPSATNFAVVNVNPIPTVLVSADITEGCLPLTVTFTNLSSPASIGGNCLWDIGPVTSTDCNTFTYTYTQAGSYDVSLTFDSPDGCTGTITLPGYINVYDNPIANFDCEPQPTTILNPVIDFTNTSSSDAVFFDWAFDIYGTSNDENPSFVFDDSIPLNYQVCLEVANQWGCIDDTCKIVEIQGEFIFYAPNAFTPDGDGINDYFFPVGSGFDNESFEFMIFNRWGELIFESSDANQQWDGRYKGLDCKQDVYIWKIKAKSDWTAEKHEYYGHVTLLR